MKRQDLEQLIDALFDGLISDADRLRLEAELLVDEEARKIYYHRARLDALLAAWGQPQAHAGIGALADSPPTDGAEETVGGPLASRVGRFRGAGERPAWHRWLAMAAAVLLALSGSWMAWRWRLSPRSGGAQSWQETMGVAPTVPSSSGERNERELAIVGYGVIAHQLDARWGGEVMLQDGSLLPAQPLHLQSGLVQLDLFSGVSLVIEGESRFQVLSPMEVRVERGKVRARVPEPAQGFRLLTRAGEVVDLGTEFAVDAEDDGASVVVIDGEVEWHPREGQAERLGQGQRAGSLPTATTSGEFIGVDEMRELAQGSRQRRLRQWEEFAETWRQDPRMLLYLRTDAPSVQKRRLHNRCANRRASDGAVVAATPSSDRWGRPNAALDFSPAGSRVRVNVPGIHQSLSLICWVKINSLDRWYNSLFLTDGHEQGEPHWQIMDDGRLFFSVKKRDVFDRSKGELDKHVYYSPPFWKPELSGRWLMIATVYDVPRMQVTHYLNGQVLSREAIPEEYVVKEVRIDNASICNWGLPERDQPRFAIRNLNGSLDEFMLLAAPLRDEEILDIYERSRP
ncbi:MAG: hypothetical protein KatS3mg111_1303 [Pirellulaceae bacterium]|nr:MAG: hypothetical protein KatS3mg111_1303 [Pirellulaceae bacterium]